MFSVAMTDLFTFTKCLAQQQHQCCSICVIFPFFFVLLCALPFPRYVCVCDVSHFTLLSLVSLFLFFAISCAVQKIKIKQDKEEMRKWVDANATTFRRTSAEPQILLQKAATKQTIWKRTHPFSDLKKHGMLYIFISYMAYSSMNDGLNSMIVKYITSIIAYYDDCSLGLKLNRAMNAAAWTSIWTKQQQ